MPLIYIGTTSSQDYLAHHGILGQKWGVRRFQNPDGTLTPEGRERYGSAKEQKSFAKNLRSTGYASDEILKRTPQVKIAAAGAKEAVNKRSQAGLKLERALDDFYGSDLGNKYIVKAAEMSWQQMGKEKNPYGMTWERLLNGYLHDDFDQGDYSSLELFKSSGTKEAQAFNKIEKEYDRAVDEESARIKEYISEFLGSYGNMTYTQQYRNSNFKPTLKVSTRFEKLVRDVAREKVPKTGY